MIYYLAKFLEGTALAILLIAFIQHFPDLMSYRTLFLGIGIFTAGWLMERFLLNKN